MTLRVVEGLSGARSATGIVVVVDVLRAFTTAAYAFAAGIEEIELVATVEEALARPGFRLGEVGGRLIPGFDHNNSPSQLLGKKLSGRAVLRTVEPTDPVSHGWQILARLHQLRLESLGRPGCFRSDTFSRFHRAATEAMHRAGCLRLHWLELDGQPVAAEYHLAGNDVLFAYQGGIDPDALDCEPGRLITYATLERAIVAGFRAFDFCRGDEPYKAHFRAAPRENVTRRMVCDRPSARLRHGIWIARENARNWMKSGWQLAVGKSK